MPEVKPIKIKSKIDLDIECVFLVFIFLKQNFNRAVYLEIFIAKLNILFFLKVKNSFNKGENKISLISNSCPVIQPNKLSFEMLIIFNGLA